jgi:uncharacterized coiled-coil protein SlyX
VVVKGSKQYRLMVVAYEPGKRLLKVVLVTLAICGFGAICLWLGFEEAQRQQVLALQEWGELQTRVAEQEEQIQLLNMQLSNSQVGENVDKQSMEVLRKEILDLNRKIVELTESNNFYRQLMEPASDNKGLAIGSFNLSSTNNPRQYHYQLVIQQFAKEPRLLTGRANVTLVGSLAGESKSFSLHELSTQVTSVDMSLKLRFYQTFEGEITLPEGFEVSRVDVLVEKTGSAVPVQRSFDWQPQASSR